MSKNSKQILHEYAQRNGYMVSYEEEEEGPAHLRKFWSTVKFNEERYRSPRAFFTKKKAGMAAAEKAVKDLKKRELIIDAKEKIRVKSALETLALKMRISSPPRYSFTATVTVDGRPYTGHVSNNHKDAKSYAAVKAMKEIDLEYYNSLLQVEFDANNDSRQPTAAESDNQLLQGTESHSTRNVLEKLNVEGAPALEKDSEMTDVENPCAAGQGVEQTKEKDAHEAEKGMSDIKDAHSVPAPQPHNHTQQDPLPAKQEHLKKETRDKEHGSQGRQLQTNQELALAESTSKRSRSEFENAEHISHKKIKTETDSTA